MRVSKKRMEEFMVRSVHDLIASSKSVGVNMDTLLDGQTPVIYFKNEPFVNRKSEYQCFTIRAARYAAENTNR